MGDEHHHLGHHFAQHQLQIWVYLEVEIES